MHFVGRVVVDWPLVDGKLRAELLLIKELPPVKRLLFFSRRWTFLSISALEICKGFTAWHVACLVYVNAGWHIQISRFIPQRQMSLKRQSFSQRKTERKQWCRTVYNEWRTMLGEWPIREEQLSVAMGPQFSQEVFLQSMRHMPELWCIFLRVDVWRI